MQLRIETWLYHVTASNHLKAFHSAEHEEEPGCVGAGQVGCRIDAQNLRYTSYPFTIDIKQPVIALPQPKVTIVYVSSHLLFPTMQRSTLIDLS